MAVSIPDTIGGTSTTMQIECEIKKVTKTSILCLSFCDIYYKEFFKRARWRNGLACFQEWLCYLQGPGFESHLRQWSFSPVTRFLHSTIESKR